MSILKSHLKKYSFIKLAVIVFSLLSSAISFATTATYIADNRYFKEQGNDGYNPNYTIITNPSSPFADWGQSKLYATGFTASGNSYAYSDYAWHETESVFDVTFSLNGYADFSLTGTAEASSGDWGGGMVFVNLYEGVSLQNILSRSYYDNGGYESYVLNELLLLAPGQYRIIITADTYPSGASSNFDVTGAFTTAAAPAVPVPPAFGFMAS